MRAAEGSGRWRSANESLCKSALPLSSAIGIKAYTDTSSLPSSSLSSISLLFMGALITTRNQPADARPPCQNSPKHQILPSHSARFPRKHTRQSRGWFLFPLSIKTK